MSGPLVRCGVATTGGASVARGAGAVVEGFAGAGVGLFLVFAGLFAAGLLGLVMALGAAVAVGIVGRQLSGRAWFGVGLATGVVMGGLFLAMLMSATSGFD